MTRHTNAHNGVVDRRDFHPVVDLLVATLLTLAGPTVAAIRDFTP